jgi:hypothetical protein
MSRSKWALTLIIVGSFALNRAAAQEVHGSGPARPLTGSGDGARFIRALSDVLNDGRMLTRQVARSGAALNALRVGVHVPPPTPRDLATNEPRSSLGNMTNTGHDTKK